MKPKLRFAFVGILFLLLGLLEHCTGPLWWDCNPPYLLCAVAVCAMFMGEKSASLLGLFAGLVADAMTDGLFGLRAVMYLILGYLIAFLTEKILSRNVFSCALAGLLSVVLVELAAWGTVCLQQPVSFVSAAEYVFLPRVVLSLPVVLLLYLIFSFLYREGEGYPVRRRR